MSMVEDLEGRCNNEAKHGDEKVMEVEDIRVRITKVAELFERKEIK